MRKTPERGFLPFGKEIEVIISVASGKGGTGKTTVATSLAMALAGAGQKVQLLDCDVEEPNAHIFLRPRITRRSEITIPVPLVDVKKCTFCGKCAKVCEFNALTVLKTEVLVFDKLCHGCGGCALFCPQDAISETLRPIGVLERGDAAGIDFVHAVLNPGEPMAPPLIAAVKGEIDGDNVAIIDSPPGTSCSVVAAVKGTDMCVLVTEPTPFGLHDLKLAVEMLEKLDVPCCVVINKCDIGDYAVDDYCEEKALPVVLRIPWKKEIASSYARGKVPLEFVSGGRTVFRQLTELLKLNKH
ncbi:MAG: ATP-binding protein [Bacillota bacterium]